MMDNRARTRAGLTDVCKSVRVIVLWGSRVSSLNAENTPVRADADDIVQKCKMMRPWMQDFWPLNHQMCAALIWSSVDKLIWLFSLFNRGIPIGCQLKCHIMFCRSGTRRGMITNTWWTRATISRCLRLPETGLIPLGWLSNCTVSVVNHWQASDNVTICHSRTDGRLGCRWSTCRLVKCHTHTHTVRVIPEERECTQCAGWIRRLTLHLFFDEYLKGLTVLYGLKEGSVGLIKLRNSGNSAHIYHLSN